MCSHAVSQIFVLDLRSTLVPLLWLPLIGSRCAGCLLIFERVSLGPPGTIQSNPDGCRYIRALGSGVVGPDCCLVIVEGGGWQGRSVYDWILLACVVGDSMGSSQWRRDGRFCISGGNVSSLW